MRKHNGSVLIELLCVVGLLGIFLSYAVLQMGNVQGRMQNMQVNLAARRLIMDARGAQETNMFDKDIQSVFIQTSSGDEFYTIYPQTSAVITKDMRRNFADFGCAGVWIEAVDGRLTDYKPTSSVNNEKKFILRHRDGGANVIINLQPVTGRIEIGQK